MKSFLSTMVPPITPSTNSKISTKKTNQKNKKIKIFKLRGNFGKAIALSTGFKATKGDIIFTLDGDLQDNPNEIPKFLESINQGYDLVTGWKRERHDPPFTVLSSRILNNFLIPLLTGVKIHDTNCGFKAYKKEVLKDLNLYGELYRYIPILAAKQNYRVTEIPVQHRARKYGKSKYGWTKMIRGFLDLITIVFLTGYLKRPGHFFGTLGLISFFLGFIISLYITYLRITTGTIQYRHPLLFLGMLLIIVGIQLISTGLLGEMITYWRQSEKKEDYLSEVID